MHVKDAPSRIFGELANDPRGITDSLEHVLVGECRESGLRGWLRLATGGPLNTLSCYETEEAASGHGEPRPALVCVEAGYSAASLGPHDRLTATTLRVVTDPRQDLSDSEQIIRAEIGSIILRRAFLAINQVPDGQLIMDFFA